MAIQNNVKLLIPLLLFSLAWVVSTNAQANDRIYTSFFNSVAIKGYDTVAYFNQREPVKGNKKFSTKHLEATWHFSNAKNLAKFKNNPDKYMPQYGGYCAYGMAKSSFSSIDPKAWTIKNDKLYLNYSSSVRDLWLSNANNNIRSADGYWKTKFSN